jgi:hypothetical protein
MQIVELTGLSWPTVRAAGYRFCAPHDEVAQTKTVKHVNELTVARFV